MTRGAGDGKSARGPTQVGLELPLVRLTLASSPPRPLWQPYIMASHIDTLSCPLAWPHATSCHGAAALRAVFLPSPNCKLS